MSDQSQPTSRARSLSKRESDESLLNGRKRHLESGQFQDELATLIMRAYFYTRRAFDEVMRPFGVSGPQAGVLNRIYEVPGISGVEISRQLLTTPQAVQPMLTALEERGLIERRPDPNRGRALETYLTAEGREIVRKCRAEQPKLEQRLGRSLCAEERQILAQLLVRYLEPETEKARRTE